AGSSLPVAHRLPPMEIPRDAAVDEVVCVYSGGIDAGDIHGIEAMQSIVERRRGAEMGVAAVQALSGGQVWKGFPAGSWRAGGWDPALFEACLSRSANLTPARKGFNDIYPTLEQMQTLVKKPTAYRYDYRDGLKVTMLGLGGLVRDCTLAARLAS